MATPAARSVKYRMPGALEFDLKIEKGLWGLLLNWSAYALIKNLSSDRCFKIALHAENNEQHAGTVFWAAGMGNHQGKVSKSADRQTSNGALPDKSPLKICDYLGRALSQDR